MKSELARAGVHAVLILSAAGAVRAGDHHRDDTLSCADCHVMHYSQSHGYAPDGSGTFLVPADGPHEYLLRDDVNDLCLACHDDSTLAPDVLGANVVSSPSDVRLAGYLNRLTLEGRHPRGTRWTRSSTRLEDLCGQCHDLAG
jgi:hypothetical protein